MNNVKKSIGWADYTWNPFTGCKRGCEYCYAHKIWNRLHRKRTGKDFNEIVFYPSRLDELMLLRKKKESQKIFVGSMSDIEYWPTAETVRLIEEIWYTSKHLFMFLTKNAEVYLNYNFPPNCMQGLTAEIPSNDIILQHINLISRQKRPYLSIEPIAGGVHQELPESIELVIVGAETGNRKYKIIPQTEWIQSIRDHVPEEKIYWKKNIQQYL